MSLSPCRSTRRRTAAVGLLAATALLAAGCGSDSGDDTPAAAAPTASSTEPVTLRVGLFGAFDYKEAGLYEEYMKLHPNITIEENSVQQSADYYKALQTRLAANSGLDDVQGIEIGFVADIAENHADQFVDFAKRPNAQQVKSTFYDWKYEAATGKNGQVVGLGTDAGPQAMCFRKDLFAKAGLPTDREELGRRWATWQGYLDLGKQYPASPTKQADSEFVDSAGGVFAAAVYQGQSAYDDAEGKPIPQSSDGVKSAWGYASQAASTGLTSGLTQFGQQWNSAFANGAFATISCPAWMLGYISTQAGETAKGLWDVAPLPGAASNWGGSWLGVPKAAKHQAEALDLVEWLTAPEQQIKMFTREEHFPSSKVAAESSEVATATSEYFSGAPIGKIFGDSAAKLRRTPIGPKDTQIQQAFTTALTSVEKGTKPDQALNAAYSATKDVLGE